MSTQATTAPHSNHLPQPKARLSQQALDLIGKTVLDENDGVLLEKPSYLGAIQVFSQYMPKFHTVDLTDKGLNIDQFKEALKNNIKLMYAIPEFQNPTGLTYSAENREEIFEIIQSEYQGREEFFQ